MTFIYRQKRISVFVSIRLVSQNTDTNIHLKIHNHMLEIIVTALLKSIDLLTAVFNAQVNFDLGQEYFTCKYF